MSASPFTQYAYGSPSMPSPPEKDIFTHLTNFTLPVSLRARRHLTKVYSTLFLTVAATAVGSLLHLRYHIGGAITHLLSFGLLIAIGASTFSSSSPSSSQSSVVKGVPNALLLLLTFGLCQGASIGPLIELAMDVDPSLIVTAFALTANIFLCFSLTSLYVPRRIHMALASVLATSISFLCCLSLLSLFIPNVWSYTVHLYVGLIVFCGYIIVDTQSIIDHAEQSDHPNYVKDALKLFTNLIAVFVRLLIILLQNAAKKEGEQERRRNHRR